MALNREFGELTWPLYLSMKVEPAIVYNAGSNLQVGGFSKAADSDLHAGEGVARGVACRLSESQLVHVVRLSSCM